MMHLAWLVVPNEYYFSHTSYSNDSSIRMWKYFCKPNLPNAFDFLKVTHEYIFFHTNCSDYPISNDLSTSIYENINAYPSKKLVIMSYDS
jgi:hypothetical protein